MCGNWEREKVERMSKGQSRQRTGSRKRDLERCKSKGKNNDVIDVDSDKIADFIIIDPPEPSERTSLGTSKSGKDKEPVYRNIIFIDDDDGDDESGDCGSPQNGCGEIGNQDCHFTSSNKSQAAHNQGWKPSPKSSKHGGACSRKTSSLNQQNFTPSTSFENDDSDSDSDIVEDYLGNIRQHWEKASLRKKTFANVNKGQSGSQNEVSAVGFKTNSQNNVGVDKTAEPPILSSANNANHDKGNLSQSACTGEGVVADTSNKSDGENYYPDLQVTIQQEICHKTSVCSTEAKNEMVSESMSNTPPQVKLNPIVLVSNGVGPSDVKNYIIADREMLKKTDAYKRAEEEEWAMRQRELQIQV